MIGDQLSIHAQNDQAIISASCSGHLSVVKLLIESGADIHARNNAAIIWASNRGHLSVVKLLIENGANVRAQNNRKGHYSIKFLPISTIRKKYF